MFRERQISGEVSLEMGRKLNLNHLTDDECDQILKVIQRDFDLRQQEKGRLAYVPVIYTPLDSWLQ